MTKTNVGWLCHNCGHAALETAAANLSTPTASLTAPAEPLPVISRSFNPVSPSVPRPATSPEPALTPAARTTPAPPVDPGVFSAVAAPAAPAEPLPVQPSVPAIADAHVWTDEAALVSDQTGQKKSHLVRNLLFIVLPALIILGVAGAVYFIILPARYATAYTQATKNPLTKLQASTNKALDSFGRPVFTSANTTPDDDSKDINYATQAVVDTKSSLSAFNDAVTTLRVLPGTSWRPGVKAALRQRQAYQDYSAKVSAFITPYNGLVSYVKIFVDFENQAQAIGTKITQAKSVPDLTASLSSLITAANNLDSQLRSTTPPSFLQDYNNAILADNDKVVATLKVMSAALSAGDQKALLQASAALDQVSADEDKLGQTLVTDLQQKSTLGQAAKDLKGQSTSFSI